MWSKDVGGLRGRQMVSWSSGYEARLDTCILREGPSSTTLFLADEEITQAGSTTVGTRYYSIGGVTVAAMSNGTENYLTADLRGTATIAVDGSSLAPAYRYYDHLRQPGGAASPRRGWGCGVSSAATPTRRPGSPTWAPARTTRRRSRSCPRMRWSTPVIRRTSNAYASDSPAAFSDPSGMSWSVTVLAVATSPAAAAARAAGMAAAVRAAGTGTAAGFRRPHRSLG